MEEGGQYFRGLGIKPYPAKGLHRRAAADALSLQVLIPARIENIGVNLCDLWAKS